MSALSEARNRLVADYPEAAAFLDGVRFGGGSLHPDLVTLLTECETCGGTGVHESTVIGDCGSDIRYEDCLACSGSGRDFTRLGMAELCPSVAGIEPAPNVRTFYVNDDRGPVFVFTENPGAPRD